MRGRKFRKSFRIYRFANAFDVIVGELKNKKSIISLRNLITKYYQVH